MPCNKGFCPIYPTRVWCAHRVSKDRLLCNGEKNSAAQISPKLIVGLKPRSRCSNQSFGRGASSYLCAVTPTDRPTDQRAVVGDFGWQLSKTPRRRRVCSSLAKLLKPRSGCSNQSFGRGASSYLCAVTPTDRPTSDDPECVQTRPTNRPACCSGGLWVAT